MAEATGFPSPVFAAYESETSGRIGVCAEGHRYAFYCTNCDSVFCGECWVRNHIGELSSHKHLELNDAIARNSNEFAESMEQLEHLHTQVESARAEVTREMHDADDELAAFCAEILRQLMTVMRHPREQRLNELFDRQSSISVTTGRRLMPDDAVDALSAQRTLETHRLTNEESARNVKSALVEVTREMHDADDKLAAFCAEILRQLMRHTGEKRMNELFSIERSINISLIKGLCLMPEDSVDALSAKRTLLDNLRLTNEHVNQSLLQFPAQKWDLSKAVTKALAAIKTNKIKQGSCGKTANHIIENLQFTFFMSSTCFI